MEKLSKKEFFNLDNGIVQDITRKFVTPHIYRNQSLLINHLQENYVEGFTFDDIENLYMSDEEIIKYMGSYDEEFITNYKKGQELIDEVRNNGEDMNEIFEWYLISDWFLKRLREINEPIIDNDFGEYWGRCCTGQSIYLDYNIQELAFEWASDRDWETNLK